MVRYISALFLVGFFGYQGRQCRKAVAAAEKRLAKLGPQIAPVSYGNITYLTYGKPGEVVLVSHGILGGFDQLPGGLHWLNSKFQLLIPSRFGYPGSDVLGDGTPAEQARAFAELLDYLGLEKVTVLGHSAGGTAAIRFALDYPERTNRLILICSAPPFPRKPPVYLPIQGPPKILCHDFLVFAFGPILLKMLGMTKKVIHVMLPVRQRKEGTALDSWVSNPDMARNFDDYPIEQLDVPTLILHAQDDTVVPLSRMKKIFHRFPDLEVVVFDRGGHLFSGQDTATPVADFITRHSANENRVISGEA